MGKGSSGSTNTITQNAQPPPQVMANYTAATDLAKQAASAPYQPYTGNIVAPFSDLQQQSFQNAYAPSDAYNQLAPGAAQLYQNAASGLSGGAGIAANAYQQAMGQYGNAVSPYAASAGLAGNIYQNAAGSYQSATDQANAAAGQAGDVYQQALGSYNNAPNALQAANQWSGQQFLNASGLYGVAGDPLAAQGRAAGDLYRNAAGQYGTANNYINDTSGQAANLYRGVAGVYGSAADPLEAAAEMAHGIYGGAYNQYQGAQSPLTQAAGQAGNLYQQTASQYGNAGQQFDYLAGLGGKYLGNAADQYGAAQQPLAQAANQAGNVNQVALDQYVNAQAPFSQLGSAAQGSINAGLGQFNTAQQPLAAQAGIAGNLYNQSASQYNNSGQGLGYLVGLGGQYLQNAGNQYGTAQQPLTSAAAQAGNLYGGAAQQYQQSGEPLGYLAGLAGGYLQGAAGGYGNSVNPLAAAAGEAGGLYQSGAETLNNLSGAAAGQYAGAQTPLQQAAGVAGGMYGSAPNAVAQAAAQAGNTYQQAAGAYGASNTPLWANTQQYGPNTVNQYLSPYLQNVVQATANQFNNQNAIQQAQLAGNAAAQGAWGGDRSAVAQAILAGQQQIAQAPVLAGLQNTGYQTAQQEFNTQQAAQLGALEAQGWLASQTGAGLSGVAAGQAGLGQAQAQAQLQAASGVAGLGQAQTNAALQGAQGIGALGQQQAAGLGNIAAGVGGLGQAQTAAQQQMASGLAGVAGQYGSLGQALSQQRLAQAAGLGNVAQGTGALGQAQTAAQLQGAQGQAALGQQYGNLGQLLSQQQLAQAAGLGNVGQMQAQLGQVQTAAALQGAQGQIAGGQALGNLGQAMTAAQLQGAQGIAGVGQNIGALGQAQTQAVLQGAQGLSGIGQQYGALGQALGQQQLQQAAGLGNVAQGVGALGQAQTAAQLQGAQGMAGLGQNIGSLGQAQTAAALQQAAGLGNVAQGTGALGQAQTAAALQNAAGLGALGTNFANLGQAQTQAALQQAAGFGTTGQQYGNLAQALSAAQLQQAAGIGGIGQNIAGLGQLRAQTALQQGAGFGNVAQGVGALGQGLTAAQLQQAAGSANIGQGMGNLASQQATGLGNLAGGMGQLGVQGANVGLSQLNALQSLGAQQQAQAQAQLNVPYQQYVAGQAYPFQTSQFYTNAVEGLGSLGGGQSQTTSPGPSALSQIGGVLAGGAGLLGATGAFGAEGWLTPLLFGAAQGGRIDPTKGAMPKPPNVAAVPMRIGIRGIPHKLKMASGGVAGNTIPSLSVPDLSVAFIPTPTGQTLGAGPPKPPQPPTPDKTPTIGQDLASLAKSAKDWFPKTSPISSDPLSPNFPAGGDYGSGGIDPLAWNAPFGGDYGGGIDFRRGGLVGYDEGGVTDDQTADDTTPPTLIGLRPEVQKFVQRESGNRPYVGYTSPETMAKTGKFTDLENAPVTATGRPDWAGDMGPAGRSTAFGPAQITGTNWDRLAPKLGVTDWRDPGAYAKVANALYDEAGDAPWHASESIPSGIAGRRQVAPEIQMAQAAPASVSDVPKSGIAGMARPQPQPQQLTGLDRLRAQGVDPWLALAAFGANMAAGRSPHALQNVGQGLLGATQYIAERTSPEAQLKRMQAQQLGLEMEGIRAFRADQQAGSSSTANGVSMLERRTTDAAKQITAVPKAIADSQQPTTVGQQPAQAMQPQTATASNMSAPLPEEMEMHNQVQQNIASVDAQIAQLQHNKRYVSTPAQILGLDNQIANLTIRRSQMLTEDPLYKRTLEGGGAAAKLPFTPYDLRPGMGRGLGIEPPRFAMPELVEQYNPKTGNYEKQFVQPPLGRGVPGLGAPQQPSSPGGEPSVPAPSPIVVKPGPEQEAQLREQGTASEKENQALRAKTLADAESAKNQNASLAVMADNAKGFYTGPGADFIGDLTKLGSLVFPSLTEPAAARESFIKNGGQLVRQATREASPRAAFQEMQFINSTLPNQEMTKRGLGLVLSEYQGLNDYKNAKAKAMQDWQLAHGGTGNVKGFEDWWQSSAPVTPYTFIMARMPEEDARSTLNRMKQTKEGKDVIQKLQTQYQFATQNGLFQ